LLEILITSLVIGAIVLLVLAYRRISTTNRLATDITAPEFNALIHSSRRVSVGDTDLNTHSAIPGWIRQLPIPFLIADYDGIIRFCSDELASLLAVERKGLERSNYTSLISNETPVAGSVVSTIDWVLAATVNVENLREKSFPIYLRGNYAGTSTAAKIGSDPNTGKDLFMVRLTFSEERKLTAMLLHPSVSDIGLGDAHPTLLASAYSIDTYSFVPLISELILTIRSLYRTEIKLRASDDSTAETPSLKIMLQKPILSEFLRSFGALLISIASSSKKVEVAVAEQQIDTEASGVVLGLKQGKQIQIVVATPAPTEALTALSRLLEDDVPPAKSATQYVARAFMSAVNHSGGVISIDTNKRGQNLHIYLPEKVEYVNGQAATEVTSSVSSAS
jgi:hypothetical protein